MEKFVTIGISVVAIIISIYSISITKKNNKKNLHKHFFEEIFFEMILKKIPDKLNELSQDKEKFSENCESLNDLFENLRDDCMFYKFFDSKFYEKIRKQLIKIDEELINCSEKNDISVDEFNKDIKSIRKKITDFYEILKKYYF